MGGIYSHEVNLSNGEVPIGCFTTWRHAPNYGDVYTFFFNEGFPKTDCDCHQLGTCANGPPPPPPIQEFLGHINKDKLYDGLQAPTTPPVDNLTSDWKMSPHSLPFGETYHADDYAMKYPYGPFTDYEEKYNNYVVEALRQLSEGQVQDLQHDVNRLKPLHQDFDLAKLVSLPGVSTPPHIDARFTFHILLAVPLYGRAILTHMRRDEARNLLRCTNDALDDVLNLANETLSRYPRTSETGHSTHLVPASKKAEYLILFRELVEEFRSYVPPGLIPHGQTARETADELATSADVCGAVTPAAVGNANRRVGHHRWMPSLRYTVWRLYAVIRADDNAYGSFTCLSQKKAMVDKLDWGTKYTSLEPAKKELGHLYAPYVVGLVYMTLAVELGTVDDWTMGNRGTADRPC